MPEEWEELFGDEGVSTEIRKEAARVYSEQSDDERQATTERLRQMPNSLERAKFFMVAAANRLK